MQMLAAAIRGLIFFEKRKNMDRRINGTRRAISEESRVSMVEKRESGVDRRISSRRS
jgi:hypothetical protein